MGRAKTRLAANLGATEAQRLNRMCHRRAMQAASGGPWTPVIHVAPDIDLHATHGDLWPAAFKRVRQGNGDLGGRLSRAFQGPQIGPLAVIGTDAPNITSQLIRGLFLRLRGYDAAIGLAHDGGFWGLSATHSFRRRGLQLAPVRWSTPHAASDVMLANPRARFAILPTLIDLDDEASVMLWRKSSP